MLQVKQSRICFVPLEEKFRIVATLGKVFNFERKSNTSEHRVASLML